MRNVSKKTMRQLFSEERMTALAQKASGSKYWYSILVFVGTNWDTRVGTLKPTEQFWLHNILKDLEIE